MFKGKKVIIFDMDGTLVDSIDIWNEVDKSLIRELGLCQELENSKIQEERDTILRKFSKAENPYFEYHKFLKEKYQITFSEEEIGKVRHRIAEDYLKNKIDYKSNAEVFLKMLKDRGYTLGIASTTKKANMDIYKKENKNIMNKANIENYFSIIYTIEDVKETKPNPEIYLKVVKELNVKKEECLIFEDSLIGVEAGKNADIEVVAIYDKYSDKDRDRINQLSTFQIKDYFEAIEILKGEI